MEQTKSHIDTIWHDRFPEPAALAAVIGGPASPARLDAASRLFQWLMSDAEGQALLQAAKMNEVEPFDFLVLSEEFGPFFSDFEKDIGGGTVEARSFSGYFSLSERLKDRTKIYILPGEVAEPVAFGVNWTNGRLIFATHTVLLGTTQVLWAAEGELAGIKLDLEEQQPGKHKLIDLTKDENGVAKIIALNFDHIESGVFTTLCIGRDQLIEYIACLRKIGALSRIV